MSHVNDEDCDPAGQHWLVIAEEAFVPADGGGRVEGLNLLRAAADAGVRLHVLVPGVDGAEEVAHGDALPGAVVQGIPRRATWRAHAGSAPYVFASRPLPSELPAELRREHGTDPYTAIVAVSFRVAHLAIALGEVLDLPVIVRPYNIESQYFRQIADGLRAPRNVPYLAEAWKLRRAEAAVHRSSRVVLFAEIAQGDVVRREAQTATPVIHVPPFLPPLPPAPPTRRPGAPGEGTLLFLASLENSINQVGIRWFVRECWPEIRRARQGADLHVVGRRAPDCLRRELLTAGARVTVDAPEVASHLAAADMFVNPVQHGAGVNIKMVEAMSAGLPVVTTSVGARGLHWRAGEHYLVADAPNEFRAAVTLLLDEPGRRAALAAAGRAFVEGFDGTMQIRRLAAAVHARRAPR